MKSVKCLSVSALAALLCTPAFAVPTIAIPLDFDNGNAAALGTTFFDAELRNSGGIADSGYLSLTDAAGSERGTFILDGGFTPGQAFTQFEIEAEIRMGGGTATPADGISFNIVRPGDPVLDDGNGWASSPSGAESNLPEEGTTTGLAIALDEYFSGGDDVIGVSIRVDNVLVDQISLPTLHGAVDDATSLQTGPSLDGLGWAPLSIIFAADSTLTISYKNTVLYDQAIALAPITDGQLVIGSRTGGFNSFHHIDNLLFRFAVNDQEEGGGSAVPEPLTATLGLMSTMGVLATVTRRRRTA